MELFFHHKASPFVRKPLLAIEELGLGARVTERQIDFATPAAMDDYAATVNPNRRFPALRDGDLLLWESNAIVRYLAMQSDTRWLGEGAAGAARVDQWLCWELAHLGPALLGLQNLRLGFLPKPPRSEDVLVTDATSLLGILDRELADHTYVAGAAITCADLAIAADFTFRDEARLFVGDEHRNVARWFAMIRERPAWQATDRMKRETLAAFGISL
ncbi:MAG TPA: glutathione S-transferase family protein [Kofleriaceae bacterium]